MNTIADFSYELIKNNHFELLNSLLLLKLNSNSHISTFMKFCIDRGDPTFIQPLVKYGCDLEMVTIAHYNSYPQNAIHYALHTENYIIASELLKYGSDIDSQSITQIKRTPLMNAVVAGNINTVKFILKNNPKKEIYDIDGKSALLFSIYRKTEIIESLLEYGVVIDQKVINYILVKDSPETRIIKKYYDKLQSAKDTKKEQKTEDTEKEQKTETVKLPIIKFKECVNDEGKVFNIPCHPLIKLYFVKGQLPDKIRTKRIHGPIWVEIEKVVDGEWIKTNMKFGPAEVQCVDPNVHAECHIIPAGLYFPEDTPVRFSFATYC